LNRRSAGGVVLAAVAIGLLGQFLFFDAALGINLPIAITVLLAAGWLLRPSGVLPRRRDLILPAAAIGFAAFVAVRGDWTLVALDTLAALGLATASLLILRGVAVLFAPVTEFAREAGLLAVSILGGIAAPLGSVLSRTAGGERMRLRLRRWVPILRGLLIALPLVVVFAVLFSAADAVFAAALEDLFNVDLNLGEALGRALLAVVIGWLAGGAIAFVAGVGDGTKGATHAPDVPWGWPRLGLTEALVVLGAIDLVFGAFVIIQGAYLFGGLDTLAASGLTYAEYARRGFFELVAVAFLAGGLIWVLESIVGDRPRTYRVLAVALAVLTGVVLASAFVRLRLYQDAYGWTVLRFYVAAAIAWLGAGVVLAAGGIWRDRTRLLPHGLLLAAIAIGLGVNVIGPERFVAQANVARALNPSLVPPDGEGGLDADYLATLGDDAVPVLLDALPHLESADRRVVVSALHHRAFMLSKDETTRAWQDWNLGRERARAQLEPIAVDLANEAMEDQATADE